MSSHTETNRSHWEEASSTYNSRFEKTILQIIKEIQARREWIGVDWIDDSSDDEPSTSDSKEPKKTIRFLDYACGTGLVSRALAPYVTQCVGIDLTEGMAKEYNKAAENQGIPRSEMVAYTGNLIDPSDPSPAALSGPEFYDFDIAAVGLGFHHFDDPALATRRLAERLKPGGVLLIIDFEPHEHLHHHHHDNPATKTVTHMGFSEADTKKMFEEAGVGNNFEYVVLGKGIVFTDKSDESKSFSRKVFMARGSKVNINPHNDTLLATIANTETDTADQFWLFLYESTQSSYFYPSSETLITQQIRDLRLLKILRLSKIKGDVGDFAFFIHSPSMKEPILLRDKNILDVWKRRCKNAKAGTIHMRLESENTHN